MISDPSASPEGRVEMLGVVAYLTDLIQTKERGLAPQM